MSTDQRTRALPAAWRDGIDILRGMAILAVVVMHAGVMTEGIGTWPLLLAIFTRMATGVQLFFVISGFLVSQSLDRCLASGEGRRGFLVRRAAKIVPLYLVFLHLNIVLFLAGRWLAPDLPPIRNSVSADNLDWPNYLIHLAFLQGFVPQSMHTLLDGSWSIVIEAYFYVLFAAFAWRWTRTAVSAGWAYAASLALAIAFFVLVARWVSGLSHYGFPAQLPCLFVGVLAHRLASTPGFEPAFSRWRGAALAVVGLLAVGLLRGETKPLGIFHAYALGFGVLVLAAPALPGLLNGPLARVLASWGRQSYALFFVHLLLLKACLMVLAGGQVVLPFGAALAVNLAVAVPLSWLVSALVFDRIDRHFVTRARLALERSPTQHPIGAVRDSRQ